MSASRSDSSDAVALGAAHDVHVVDGARIVLGDVDELAETELLVARRRLAPGRVPAVQLAEEDAEHGGLELVEARVVADQLERLLVARAVEAEQADGLGERRVLGGDEPAVAEREQVLGREEAERRGGAHGADAPVADARAERLRRVLEHRDPLRQRVDRRRPAEQVDGDDRLRLASHARDDVGRIEVGSRLSVAGSMSQKTGVAPRCTIGSTVA